MASSPPPPRLARLVIAGRVALLLLAAGGAVAGIVLGRRPAALESRAGAAYACPMHREITAAAPGNCPICGMALTPEAARPARETPELPPYDVRAVRLHALSQPILAPARIDENGGVTALLHEDELAALQPDDVASFTPTSAPGAPTRVKLAGVEPRAWDGDTREVAFEVEGERAAGATSGQAGWLALPPKRQELIMVPEFAVLRSRRGPFVLVASAGDRRFVERPVRLGRTFFGNAVITGGLVAGERIATAKAFFLDGERRLQDANAEAIEVGP